MIHSADRLCMILGIIALLSASAGTAFAGELYKQFRGRRHSPKLTGGGAGGFE